jgi:F0F1-type ATP synthase membrane subunit b/b'
MSMTGSQVFDWIVSLANFGIMFILFRLVVIIPMQDAVKLREQRVALRLKEIDQIAKEAEETKVSFQEKFGKVDGVVAEVKSSSERSLAQAKVKMEERAAAEERYIRDKADAESKSIKREAEAQVRTRLAEGAVARAQAFLKDALDSSAQDKILSAGVKEIGELNAS